MRLAAGLLAALSWTPEAAATLFDEFEVHDLNVPAPGHASLDQHFNWGVRGLREPGWPGGLATNGAGYASTELGLGLMPGWSAAIYLPAALADGRATPAGGKLRNLFRFYGSEGDGWSFGLLAQIGLLSRQVSSGRVAPELRPIASWRSGSWFAVGSVGFAGVSGPEARSLLSPQARVNYTLPSGVELGVEHYAELGRIDRPHGPTRQAHQSFLTVGMPLGSVDVNLGIGRGLTSASEPWVARLRLGVEF